MVVKSPAQKKLVLQMLETIGFDFPILTKAEYLALENARWHAYQDMCLIFNQDGTIDVDRNAFSYEAFIKGLYRHSDPNDPLNKYWNIDPKTAKDIMMSFGFVPDPSTGIGTIIQVGHYEIWAEGTRNALPYSWSMAARLKQWFLRYHNDDYQHDAGDTYMA